ncbi:MAG: hypothetical protein CMG54_00315 [Candidatus Marinimicrobia bacterium]|nr:hypothetical protein [Candidatus Neomarinimicrobiota bacterium]
MAAVVENNVILKSDVMQQAFLFAQQQGVDPSKRPSLFENIYLQTLDQMINNLILYEVSLKDTNIVVDQLTVEESLNSEIKRRIEYAGSARKLEEMFGEPLSMIRAKLRLEIKKAIRVESFTGSIYQSVSPTMIDVKMFYNAFKDSLPASPENISFSVFEWPLKVDLTKEIETQEFLKKIKNRVLSGESFYDLAIEHSEDLGSASSGGKLGYFVRGSLFPEYEEVAFSLNPGDVSDPFKTDLGYHIVLLEDRVGEKIKTSHILKKIKSGDVDLEKNKLLFSDFLGEYDVYNYVEKFDSLCAHFSLEGSSFNGIFPKTPVSSLPDFLDKKSLLSTGFKDIIVGEKSLFLIRVWDYNQEAVFSLENNYNEILGLTRNKLINDKILDLINKEKENLYVEKFY